MDAEPQMNIKQHNEMLELILRTILQIFCGPALVSRSFLLAQAATASHPKVTLSISRQGDGGCKTRSVAEELVACNSAVLLSAAPIAASHFNHDDENSA